MAAETERTRPALWVVILAMVVNILSEKEVVFSGSGLGCLTGKTAIRAGSRIML